MTEQDLIQAARGVVEAFNAENWCRFLSADSQIILRVPPLFSQVCR